MKIKAVRTNKWYKNQDYITLGKEYEVLYHSGGCAEFYDNKGDLMYVTLKSSAYGFDFEIVREETKGACPDPMPIVEPEEDPMETTESNPLSGSQVRSVVGKLVTTLSVDCEPFDEVIINGRKYVLYE